MLRESPFRLVRRGERRFNAGSALRTWLLLAVLVAGLGSIAPASAQPCPNCEPGTSRRMDWCQILDEHRRPPPEFGAAMRMWCTKTALSWHPMPGVYTFPQCGPVRLPLPSSYVGGSAAPFVGPITWHWNNLIDGTVYRSGTGEGSFMCGCLGGSVVGADGSCNCPRGHGWVAEIGECKPYIDVLHAKRKAPPNSCPGIRVGNPIAPLSGTKEETVEWPSGLRDPVRLTYDTQARLRTSDGRTTIAPREAAAAGALWTTGWHRSLRIKLIHPLPNSIIAMRGGHEALSFVIRGGVYLPTEADLDLRITSRAGGGWTLIDHATGRYEIYEPGGRLQSESDVQGTYRHFRYSDASTPLAVAPRAGLLIAVVGHDGRSVRFTYEPGPAADPTPRLSSITDAGGRRVAMAYDASGNLVRLTWPDGSERRFLYEDARHPWALTGQVDELGQRTATYGYDADGRAVLTERAGGVQRYTARWASPSRLSIVDEWDATAGVIWRHHYWSAPVGAEVVTPRGDVVGIGATNVLGAPVWTSRTQPAGSGCAASTSHQAFDAQGLPAWRDDFNGTRTCFAHDAGRKLEVTRVEGLPGGTACGAVLASGAALPPASRKRSTQWHPSWRLPARVAEPGRITTYVYNGQPDPFAGGVIASCAPAALALDPGVPKPVLCRRVETATTDADGSQGFAAGAQAGVAPRHWRWTYDNLARPLTAIDPRGSVSSWAYHALSTADVVAGDLQRVMNAAGHVTTFTRYDAMGEPLEWVDPNGIATTVTRDLRSRLRTVTTAGLTTTFDYWPNGLLRRSTAPDGTFVEFDYDAAHRLVGARDDAGNRLAYTLDAQSQPQAEELVDASGTLRRRVERVFDALGRVQDVIGRAP